MLFPELIEGRLLKRYKRFLADVELASGELVVAHCPNPGSMKTMKESGSQVWLSRSDNPKRKLGFTWELINSEGAMTLVNTARANAIVGEALRAQAIEGLRDFSQLSAEVAYGQNSRVDFFIEWEDRACYLEVKNVTMADGPKRAAFPDSVTSRGSKHLRELMAMVAAGHRAVLLFCCSREGTRSIRPADEIDPVYGQSLREAAAAGVEILAYGCAVSAREVVLQDRLELRL